MGVFLRERMATKVCFSALRCSAFLRVYTFLWQALSSYWTTEARLFCAVLGRNALTFLGSFASKPVAVLALVFCISLSNVSSCCGNYVDTSHSAQSKELNFYSKKLHQYWRFWRIGNTDIFDIDFCPNGEWIRAVQQSWAFVNILDRKTDRL